MKKMLFRITGVTRDRRNLAQLECVRATEQARLDLALERLWRERVQARVLDRKHRRAIEILRAPAAPAHTADVVAMRRTGANRG